MGKEKDPPDSTLQDTRIQAGVVSAGSTKSATREKTAESNLVKEEKGTHFNLLDPKHVQTLRGEMELRGASNKGLKNNQLVTRLAKILKTKE
ncbi:unnamed protein product [Allacma fusca]|uniref:Uncharacterized protein n=1 Tax=Allacma fusca TaxID=39272 RepID=A0A8J2KD23_9HEXA|nr:unnamed protein product [Allacma fusca]